MAKVGQTIENPVAGDRVTFLETIESGDARLLCDTVTIAGAQGPPEHIHPRSLEHFEVLEGAIIVEVEGAAQTVRAGESTTVGAGAAHRFMSHPELDGRALVSFERPGRMEDFLVSFYELSRAGRTDSEGKPSMLQIAVTFSQLTEDIRTTLAPWPAGRWPT